MIPRRIFFFWSGDNLSYLRYLTLVSFKKLNPSWKVQLYVSSFSGIRQKTWNSDVKQDFFNYKNNENYFDRLEQLGIEIIPWKLINPSNPHDNNWDSQVGPNHKSDFFKWEQLSKGGGIFGDMDILFIRPIDQFYNSIKSFSTGLSYIKGYFSVGFLASEPGNKLFHDIFVNAFKTYTEKRYQSSGVEALYDLITNGDYFDVIRGDIDWNYLYSEDLLNLVAKKYTNQRIYNIGMDVVYPWKHDQTHMIFRKLFKEGIRGIKPNTIGIHWYAGNLISQEFNNIINETTWKYCNSLITHFIRKIQ